MFYEPLRGPKHPAGITAGVAAYKAPALVRALRAEGAEINVVMSANAHKFVPQLHYRQCLAIQCGMIYGIPAPKRQWDTSNSPGGQIKSDCASYR